MSILYRIGMLLCILNMMEMDMLGTMAMEQESGGLGGAVTKDQLKEIKDGGLLIPSKDEEVEDEMEHVLQMDMQPLGAHDQN